MFLVRGRYVITMDDRLKVFKRGCVVVDGNVIVDVGPFDDLRTIYRCDEVIGDDWHVVLPGFVNCHYHSREQLAVSLFPDGLGEKEWFWNYVLPYHEALSPEDEKLAFELALVAMARNGVTTFSDGGLIFPDTTLTALEKIPLRCYASTWCWDIPQKIAKSTEQAFREIVDLYMKYHGKNNGLLNVCATPISVLTCSEKLLTEVFSWAREKGLKTSIHVASFVEEVEKCLETFGTSPADYLRRIGVLDQSVNLLHAVHLSDQDVEAVARSGAGVVCCPTSSTKKGKGLAVKGKVPELLEKGVKVGLGGDGAPSSQHVDMLRMASLFAGLFRDSRMDAKAVKAVDALKALTIGGAEVLGASAVTGSIVKGKKADLVLLDLRDPSFIPLTDVVQALVFSATGSAVDTVIVDGKILVEGGIVKNVDYREIASNAEKAVERIAAKIGLQIPM
ncbi:MAG: amidohydrolase family protein [Candidatus Caldarchaeum sp.]|nr:amidohydrolase family protein [Candidatus Caldarchaeum sp.]